jgi:hypothetical protein
MGEELGIKIIKLSNLWEPLHLNGILEEREITEGNKGYQLREGSVPHKTLFKIKNDEIASKKPYF